MKHRELWIFGVLALVTAVLFLRTMYNPPAQLMIIPEPVVYEQPYPTPIYEAPVIEPEIEQTTEVKGPARGELLPDYIEFSVNRIIVPPAGAYPFLPIRIDRPRTFAGKFGPYTKDPTAHLEVQLCSYAYKYDNQILACDKPRMSFREGYVMFAVGYAEDEYIGGQAIRDFGAGFTIKSKTYGVIAESNEAIVNLVED